MFGEASRCFEDGVAVEVEISLNLDEGLLLGEDADGFVDGDGLCATFCATSSKLGD